MQNWVKLSSGKTVRRITYNPYGARKPKGRNAPPQKSRAVRRRCRSGFVETRSEASDGAASGCTTTDDSDAGSDADSGSEGEATDGCVFAEKDDEFVPKAPLAAPGPAPATPPVGQRRSSRLLPPGVVDPGDSPGPERPTRQAALDSARVQVETLQREVDDLIRQRDKAQRIAAQAMRELAQKTDRPDGDSPHTGSTVSHPPPSPGKARTHAKAHTDAGAARKFVRPASEMYAGIDTPDRINELRDQGFDPGVAALITRETAALVKTGLLCLLRSFLAAIHVDAGVAAHVVTATAAKMGVPAHPTPRPKFWLLAGEPGSGKSHVMATVVRAVHAVLGPLSTFMRFSVAQLRAEFVGVQEEDTLAALSFARENTVATTVGAVLDILGVQAPPGAVSRDTPLVLPAAVTIIVNDEVDTLIPARTNDASRAGVVSTITDLMGRPYETPGTTEVVFLGATNNPQDVLPAMLSRAKQIPVLRPTTPEARAAAVRVVMGHACPGWTAFPSPGAQRAVMALFAASGGDRRSIADIGAAVLDAAAAAATDASGLVPLAGKAAMGNFLHATMAKVWGVVGGPVAAHSLLSVFGVEEAADPDAEARRRVDAVPEATYLELVRGRVELLSMFAAFAVKAAGGAAGEEADEPLIFGDDDDG